MTSKSDKISNEEYFNQYSGWLLAAKLAEWLGMEAGVTALPIASSFDVDATHYCLAIELPSGQVMVSIPAEFMEGKWKFFNANKLENRDYSDQIKAIEDCLYGVLVSKHVLLIPEQKEETE